MNKRSLIAILALVIVIVGAVGVFAATRPADIVASESSPSSTPPAPTPAETPTSDESAPAVPASPGIYVDYSPTAISSSEGRTFLFFHAPWCPQCRSVEADILADGVPAGVTIIKVDYDTHQDLRQEYGVTLQTTFVEVDRAGAGLQSYVAYEDSRLRAVIDAML